MQSEEAEISVVANAIAYVLEGGVPPNPVKVSRKKTAKYHWAAVRAIEQLDRYRQIGKEETNHGN